MISAINSDMKPEAIILGRFIDNMDDLLKGHDEVKNNIIESFKKMEDKGIGLVAAHDFFVSGLTKITGDDKEALNKITSFLDEVAMEEREATIDSHRASVRRRVMTPRGFEL